MKKLITIMMVAALALSSAIAAQCEGKTQTGARCKREAAEGSKYCIGHKDQAKVAAEAKAKKSAAKAKAAAAVEKPVAAKEKSAAVAKEKDDGQCWAVTEKGTRCKHKKDGTSDYCKLHAVSKKPSKPQTRCRAMNWNGQQCSRRPEPDSYYCKQHIKGN